jgi:hypothetical protein
VTGVVYPRFVVAQGVMLEGMLEVVRTVDLACRDTADCDRL